MKVAVSFHFLLDSTHENEHHFLCLVDIKRHKILSAVALEPHNKPTNQPTYLRALSNYVRRDTRRRQQTKERQNLRISVAARHLQSSYSALHSTVYKLRGRVRQSRNDRKLLYLKGKSPRRDPRTSYGSYSRSFGVTLHESLQVLRTLANTYFTRRL